MSSVAQALSRKPLAGYAASLKVAAESALRPYAGILLSSRPAVGLLVLLAIAESPRTAAASVASVAIAALTTWLFGLGPAAVRAGHHGCAAVLTTLALAAFPPDGGASLALVALGAVLSVLMGALFEALFGSLALPSHSLPFVATVWTLHLAARLLPAADARLALVQTAILSPRLVAAGGFLDVPAALVFQHGLWSGTLVTLALLLHSRIATALGALGILGAYATYALVRSPSPWTTEDLTAAFNAMLTAMALGGVWFVPHPSATLLAAVSAVFASLLTYAAFGALGPIGLPVVSLPFGIVVVSVLLASRRRERDNWPRSALPAVTPELTHTLARAQLRRYGDVGSVALRLPFRGSWYVSQGNDGPHTHRGAWRHGFDFEANGEIGAAPRAAKGARLTDYPTYGLPVLAAAPGTVVRVVDGIADNLPGTINIEQNWGNAVVVAHGPALHSVYAHLQPGSLRVRCGDVVSTGSELGRAGNSGRSGTPHLHFQLQRSAALGTPTIPAGFCDVVTSDSGHERYAAHVVVKEGQCIRPLLRDDSLARSLGLAFGTITLEDPVLHVVETARVELDLFGNTILRSDRAEMKLAVYDTAVVVTDAEGADDSMLLVLARAIGRVPLDRTAALSWLERMPRHLFARPFYRGMLNVLDWLLPGLGDTLVRFRLERLDGAVRITSESNHGSGEVTLSLSGNAHRVVEKRRGRNRVVILHPGPLSAAPPSARSSRLLGNEEKAQEGVRLGAAEDNCTAPNAWSPLPVETQEPIHVGRDAAAKWAHTAVRCHETVLRENREANR